MNASASDMYGGVARVLVPAGDRSLDGLEWLNAARVPATLPPDVSLGF